VKVWKHSELSSTQRASKDAGVKHLGVRICLFITVLQILQSI